LRAYVILCCTLVVKYQFYNGAQAERTEGQRNSATKSKVAIRFGFRIKDNFKQLCLLRF